MISCRQHDSWKAFDTHVLSLLFWPLFVFSMQTGASLDLMVLVQSFGFAALVALVRAATIFMGSATGGYLSGQSKLHNMYMWMTLITQAGVSLGLASEVGMAFPEFGRSFQTSIIGVVLVAQLVGPILFKVAIKKVGEAGKGGADGAIDEDADIPTAMVLGTTPDALALATRLLKQRWNVLLVAPNQRDADTAKRLVAEYAVQSRAEEDKAKNVASVLVEKVVAKPVANAKSWWQNLLDKFSKTSSSAGPSGAAGGVGGHVKMADEGPTSPNASNPTPVGPGIELPTKSASNGATAPTVPADNAAAAAPAQDAHHGDHEHHARWMIEEHLEVVALLPEDSGVPDSMNPFLVAISTPSGAAAPGSGGATPTANPLSAGAAATAAASASGSSTDYTLSRLVSLVQSSSRTLQAVAAMLPSDASNFACVTLVDKLIAAAPKRSHLHSVRIVASCRDPAWAAVFENATGAIALHEFSLSAHAASRIITVSAGKPALLLPPLPNSDEIAKAVQRVIVEGAHYWNLSESAPTQPFNSSSPSDPVVGSSTGVSLPPGISSSSATSATGIPPRRSRGASAGIAGAVVSHGEAATSAAEVAAAIEAAAARHTAPIVSPAGGAHLDSGASAPSSHPAAPGVTAAEDAAWSHGGAAAAPQFAAEKTSGGFIGRKLAEAEEVPSWERDNYIEQLHAMGEESEDLGALEGKLQAASKTKKKENLDMFGSVLGESTAFGAEEATESNNNGGSGAWDYEGGTGGSASTTAGAGASGRKDEEDGGMWT
jgi:hypothetical protein